MPNPPKKEPRWFLISIIAGILLFLLISFAVIWPGTEASRIVHTETQRIEDMRVSLPKVDWTKSSGGKPTKTLKSSFSTIDVYAGSDLNLDPDKYLYGILYHDVPPEICTYLGSHVASQFDGIAISTPPMSLDSSSEVLESIHSHSAADIVVRCNDLADGNTQTVDILFLEK